MEEICKALHDEYETLDSIISQFNANNWTVMTHGNIWRVRDQVEHIAYVDSQARLSATSPEAFISHAQAAMLNIEEEAKKVSIFFIKMNNQQLIEWWRIERNALLAALLNLDPKDRLPWYGPSMSAKSFATARLMETWAHGQDIADALKICRKPTDRLYHIAHLGVSTFKWSFYNRQMGVPNVAIRVELTSPTNTNWEWGPEDAKEVIRGTAEGFCMVVTQRRHYMDTDLEIKGETAEKWMSIAQCFAGPPTNTREPGLYPKHGC